MDHSRIAIVGAGIAGLTAAALLQQQGYSVQVYEQAPGPSRVGAGIILGASTAKVLRRLGLEQALVTAGIKPDAFVSRDMATGAVLNELVFDAQAEARFGGPFVNIHRADLHRLLVSALEPGTIQFGCRLEGLCPIGERVQLDFAGRPSVEADIVVGADGIHSIVRAKTFGQVLPRYTGKVALRAVFPTRDVVGLAMRDCTKWWGEDRHLLAYFMSGRRDECYIMAAVPGEAWDVHSAPRSGSRDDFLAALPDAHPELQALLLAAQNVSLLPICDRVRDDRWSLGRVVLMGDACHAVRPFMAAGGSMAIEDAAILARAIAASATPQQAFAIYERVRIPRVAEVQRISEENSWLRAPGDPSWFFGYDPFAHDLGSVPTVALEA